MVIYYGSNKKLICSQIWQHKVKYGSTRSNKYGSARSNKYGSARSNTGQNANSDKLSKQKLNAGKLVKDKHAHVNGAKSKEQTTFQFLLRKT